MTIETFFTSNSGLGYNLRLIEYPNGSAQIRIYDKPLSIALDNPYETDEIPVGYVQEPFKGTFDREVEEFEEIAGDPLLSQQASLSRTKRIIGEYARSAFWEWFCTFTFSPEKSERSSYKKCSQQMRTWLKNTRDRKAPDLKYLAVPELHKDLVSWHFHALLANCGELQFKPSGLIRDGMPVYNIPGWRSGFSTATKVKDTYRIQKYIVKYMSKQCHIMSKGEHRYFVSQGLPHPKHSLFFIEKGEELETVRNISDALGLTVSWISGSKPGVYTGVTYIELEP